MCLDITEAQTKARPQPPQRKSTQTPLEMPYIRSHDGQNDFLQHEQVSWVTWVTWVHTLLRYLSVSPACKTRMYQEEVPLSSRPTDRQTDRRRTGKMD